MFGRFIFWLLVSFVASVCYRQADAALLDVESSACETLIGDESRSGARTRAIDKAVFTGVRKLEALDRSRRILDDHELNVLVYRLVDEYVEDLSVETAHDEDGKVCVNVKGKVDSEQIALVEKDFIKNDAPLSEPEPEAVKEAAVEVMQTLSVTPEDPESLALVYVRKLKYFNGAETSKFTADLTGILKDNPYFYLTEEEELADYVLQPKVLKAKVDSLDASHKRLQMVVAVEIDGLEKDTVDTYQNRFVLFGSEEDEQQIAARLIRKLLIAAGDEARRRLEHTEQVKFEQKTLGKPLSQ